MSNNKKKSQHNLKMIRRFDEDIWAELALSAAPSKTLDYIFEIYKIQQDRISYSGKEQDQVKALNEEQARALTEVKASFNSHDVCLLHGVTASGKTEV